MKRLTTLLFLGLAAGCGLPEEPVRTDPPASPWASELISFDPGSSSGFGAERLPNIVLGPALSPAAGQASLDVVSLGVGGSIVLGFGEHAIVDQAGPDFVVFENPFWIMGDSSRPFAELGEVAVSQDGQDWHVYSCDPAGSGQGRYPGCAGWTPTLVLDAWAAPLDAADSGGDGFDLADLGLAEARFVRVRDLAASGEEPNAGFDLDAIGLVHWR